MTSEWSSEASQCRGWVGGWVGEHPQIPRSVPRAFSLAMNRASTTKCEDPWRLYHALLLLGCWSVATKHRDLNKWFLEPSGSLRML